MCHHFQLAGAQRHIKVLVVVIGVEFALAVDVRSVVHRGLV